MKKLILTFGFLIASISTICAAKITINTSCGVSIDMVYDDTHTLANVINDALILDSYFRD